MTKNNTHHIEKGSIAVFTIATVISFLLILGAIFTISATIRRNQLNSLIQIKKIYSQKLEISG